MQHAIAEATRYNEETPPQGMGRPQQSLQEEGESHNSRAKPGNQTVASLPSSWAGHLIEHPKIKPKPLNTAFEKKKGFFNELCCSRIKHSSLKALKEQQSAQLSN